MSKIGVEGRDRDARLEAIEHMRQVGVANIKPDVADQVADYLEKVFGPDSEVPRSPAQLPQYQKVKQERDYFTDDALNIVYVDYQLTGNPRTSRHGKARQRWKYLGGNGWRTIETRSRNRRSSYVAIAGSNSPLHSRSFAHS